ncbi:MAG: hypothetical protein AAB791_02905, partial [Patescibacteria group bacterium]
MEQETNFSINIAEIKRSVPNPSPAFRIWIWKVLGKQLNQIVRGLILGEAAANAEEALLLLNQLSQSLNPEEITVACCDLENKTSAQKFNLLNELLDGDLPKTGSSYQFFGTISHSVIPRIFSGEIFRKSPSRKTAGQLALFTDVLNNAQLELFPQLLFTPDQFPVNGKNHSRITAGRVSKLWEQMAEEKTKAEKHWFTWFLSRKKEIEEISKFFYRFFPRQLAAIDQHCEHRVNSFLKSLTLLSWASALLHVKGKGEKILFTEIPVLPRTERLGGGRIDALEVVAIDDQPPDKKQKQALQRLA